MAAALTQLYKQYLHLVRSQAARVLGAAATQEVDDLVQEVFLQYWRQYGTQPQRDRAGLLFRMATNAAISALRGRRRRSARESRYAETQATRDHLPGRAEFESLLALVTQQDAAVAALYHWVEMSQEEIAETLEITRHEVMQRLKRVAAVVQREARANQWHPEVWHADKV